MVNSRGGRRWLLTWPRKNKYKLTQQLYEATCKSCPASNFLLCLRVLFHQVWPVACLLCPPSPSPGGRPRGWCHPGPHWKPIRPPTAEQFHLQLSPFCRLEIGRSISPPRTHTKALRLPSFSLVGSSRPQDERDCHPTCRIWSSTRRVMEIFLLQFHVCSDNWTPRCQLVCHSLTRILQKLSWSSD